jgi:PAS domain S-box-containing protein
MIPLHEPSAWLAATDDLPSILSEMLDATMELQHADFGTLQLYEEASGSLRIATHKGVDQPFLDHFEKVDAGEASACGLALAAGAPIIIEDVTVDPRYAPHREIAAATGYRGVQSTPLFDRRTGKLIGMLATQFRQPHRPSERELRLTGLFARQAADVLTLKVVEQRLCESETQLRAAVNLVGLGRYNWNPQTNELQWDEAVRRMWGLAAGVPPDLATWRAGIHTDDLARVDAALEQCVDPRGDGVYDVEYRVVGKDAVVRWIATQGRTTFENGAPVSFQGVALDVTGRKTAELQLERRVEERTRALLRVDRELRAQTEQREKAEAAVEHLQRLDAIGQITSGVAHDFNNLLSIIVLNARLLERNLGDARDRQSLELIRSAAENGTKLTRQLLTFVRKQRLEPQMMDLNRKIVDASSLLRATLRGSVQLETVLAADLWPVHIDPSQIESILLNLMINGRDAMESGGTLTIETFNIVVDEESTRPEALAGGEYVGVTVTDTGVGIPDDVLPHVFEPFFTTKARGEGSGLGLAQILAITKQAGGGVQIRTRVGRGTSATVFLPRAGAHVATGQSTSVGIDDAEPLRIKKILVVDDDEAVLTTTVLLLEALGFSPIGAGSGGDALRLLASGVDVDVVLTDFAMPGMTGVELAEAVRAARPDLPVVLVTGYAERSGSKEFDEKLMLQKPYADSELAAKINFAVTGHRALREASATSAPLLT